MKRNPDLRVYQHHDPNQDRLMLRRMAYFRMKRLRLGQVYESFLRKHLAPGSMIFTVECRFSWPSTRVTDHHIFQFGGTGDVSPQEYFKGSERVAADRRQRGSNRRRWEPPPADGDYPEAEWGFDADLLADVVRFAREHGYHVRRIVFDMPHDLSPLVADLYRWWYRRQQRPTNRLLVESFVHLQPNYALRMSAVPYWSVFNDYPSVRHLADYLDRLIPTTISTPFSSRTASTPLGSHPSRSGGRSWNGRATGGNFWGWTRTSTPRISLPLSAITRN